MGLSADPAKRRRQLEALAGGAERRAATLRARIADIDASGEAPSVDPPPPTAPAELEPDVGEALREAEAGARIARGSYGELPPTPPEPGPPESPAPPADGAFEDEPEPAVRPAEEEEPPAPPAEPSGLVRFGARAFGIQP